MNTLEFKAAIRPQLEMQIARWYTYDLEVTDRRNVGVGFKAHMLLILGNDKACKSLKAVLDELPLSLKAEKDNYLDQLTDQILRLYFLAVNRYEHLDRSVPIGLKVRAYEYRLANLLTELKEMADANSCPELTRKTVPRMQMGRIRGGFERIVVQNEYAPVINGWNGDKMNYRPHFESPMPDTAAF